MKINFIGRIKLFYYTVLTFGFGITGIVIMGLVKLFGCACFYFVEKWTKPFLDGWAFVPGFLAFWLGVGLWWALLRIILPGDFDKIDSYMNKFKISYTEKYGADFPEPKYGDFNISNEEIKIYWNRFQLKEYKFLLWIVWIVFAIYAMSQKWDRSTGLCLLIGVIVFLLLVSLMFNFIDKEISKRCPNYENIKRYQERLEIFSRIRREKWGID